MMTSSGPTSDSLVWATQSWPQQFNGFFSTLFVILASELGDKTFIIATIMAMKFSRRSVFLGAMSAATLMITLSGFAMADTEEFDTDALEEIKNRESTHHDKASPWRKSLSLYLSFVFIETFTMNFFAEWGDKSQVSTILLAAQENIVGVFLGAVCGHTICNGLAVMGGKFIGKLISVRTVTISGGMAFLGFAIYPLIAGDS